MQSRLVTDKKKRLQKLPSCPSFINRSHNGVPSNGTQQFDQKAQKNGPKQRRTAKLAAPSLSSGAATSTVDEKSPIAEEDELEDACARLLKLSSDTGNTCACVCLDAKPAANKQDENFCGWESQKLTGDTKNPHHFPIIEGNKDLATVEVVSEVKAKCKPLSSTKLGYISSANKVKRYPFHHCTDDDTSVYMRDYREKFTCKTSFAKVMGLPTTNTASRTVPFGLDRIPDKKSAKSKSKATLISHSGRNNSSVSNLTRQSSIESLSPDSSSSKDKLCAVNQNVLCSTEDQKVVFPHEKYIAKYRQKAMEEKKAREAKRLPSFSFKTKFPEPEPPKASVCLPFNYKPPSRLLHRKKMVVAMPPYTTMPPMPPLMPPPSMHPTSSDARFRHNGNYLNGRMTKATSCTKLPSASKKKDQFFSVIPANMCHLEGGSSCKMEYDHTAFQRKNRSDNNWVWNRQIATKSNYD